MLREISVFDKVTGEFVDDVDITIHVQDLRRIITARDDDPNMIMEYDIDFKAAGLLSAYTELIFDFDKYVYDIGTYSS